MNGGGATLPIAIISQDDEVRAHVIGGLTGALLPVAEGLGVGSCALLVVDAPLLSHGIVSKAVARAHVSSEPKGAPVIFLNDNATGAEREAAFLAGAADVLPRLVATDLLIARAMRLITMNATQVEAIKLSQSAYVASSLSLARAAAKVFHLRPADTPRLSHNNNWHLTEFDTAHSLLAATVDGWPDVIAFPGTEATHLLPGLLSRRGALNTQFVALETPFAECAASLSLGAADAIPTGANLGEIIARIEALAAEAQDIDRAHAHLRAGLDMSYNDALTGLHNRRFFDQRFRGLYQRARLLGLPLSVLIFDIDNFKQVNDVHGHAAGDAVLREFSNRLSANVRVQDLVTRYGGEEFIIAMPQAAIEVAMGAGERVRAAIASPGFPISNDIISTVTVSVGVATMSPDDRQAEDMLARADAALFSAKGLGRNRVACAA